MAFQLIEKNTFFCTLSEEEVALALERASCRRHRTLHASAFSKLGDDAADGICGGVAVRRPSEMSSVSTAAMGSASPSSASTCSSEHLLGEEEGAVPLVLAGLGVDRVRALAFDADGAEALAAVAAQARPTELRALIAGLRGSVCELARSAGGSEVLEQLLHHAGTRDTTFVAEELLADAATAYKNANACSVLCRLVEYASEEASTAALVDATLASVGPATLMGHKYGHRLVAALLSSGLPHQRRHLLGAVQGDVHRFARHRFASVVVEQALVQATDVEAERLSLAIMAKAGAVVELARHHAGVHVVRAMLEGPCRQQVAEFLRKAGQRLARDAYGSALLREVAPEVFAQVGSD